MSETVNDIISKAQIGNVAGFKVDGEELLVMREEDVMGVVEG